MYFKTSVVFGPLTAAILPIRDFRKTSLPWTFSDTYHRIPPEEYTEFLVTLVKPSNLRCHEGPPELCRHRIDPNRSLVGEVPLLIAYRLPCTMVLLIERQPF